MNIQGEDGMTRREHLYQSIRMRIAALHLGHNKRTATAKLATRWLEAGLAQDLDTLMRIQVLEGLAGVPVDTWIHARPPARGLLKAKEALNNPNINPKWFDPRDSGMYAIILGVVRNAIRKIGLRTVDPMDIINSLLLGLGVNIDNPQNLRPCYAVGRNKGEGILQGKEDPERIAKGSLSRYFWNKAGTYAAQERHETQMSLTDDGNYQDIPDSSMDPSSPAPKMGDDAFGEFLADVFRTLSDPLGVKIRNVMRNVWADSAPMTTWLDIVESGKGYPTQRDVAQAVGMTPGALRARHWVPGWKAFFKALTRNAALIAAFQTRALKEGFLWEPEDLVDVDIDGLLNPRKRRFPTPR